ncbi:hypothetical protein BROUX41_005842 [Berkeleyomyces rouxiae]
MAAPAATAPTAAAPAPFPKLALIDPANPPRFQHPTKRINDGDDVEAFLSSLAYRDIGVWLMQLNRALCPRRAPESPTTTTGPPPAASPGPSPGPGPSAPSVPGASLAPPTTPALKLPTGPRERVTTFSIRDAQLPSAQPASVRRVRQLLDRADALLASAPAEPGPKGAAHRFGNPAFRRWVALVQEQARAMMQEELGLGPEAGCVQGRQTADADADAAQDVAGEQATALDELVSYFMGAWGSAERLDYGTGHELSFLAFLGGLWKLGFFADGEQDGPIERAIVFGIFEPYLVLVRKVILLYRLEPAGSHGVWGLDDHFFLPYIFGSAQLTRPIGTAEPMPLEGSVRSAPRPASITDARAVAAHAAHNLYFSAIAFIHAVKRGPFAEHSPVLYDVSGVTAGWGKINKGMLKMFNAEVLAKFPVVQHFRFGALFAWAPDPHTVAPPVNSVHLRNQPHHLFQKKPAPQASPHPAVGGMAPPMGGAGTMAPWAVAGNTGRDNASAAASARASSAGTAAWAEATRMPASSVARGVGGGIPYSRVSGDMSTSRSGPTSEVPGNGGGVGDSSTVTAQASTRAPWAK